MQGYHYLQYGTPHVWLEDGVTCGHAQQHAPRWYCEWKNMLDTESVSRSIHFPTMEEAIAEAEKHIFNHGGFYSLRGEMVVHPNMVREEGEEEYIPF
jgi:hypothetical protein